MVKDWLLKIKDEKRGCHAELVEAQRAKAYARPSTSSGWRPPHANQYFLDRVIVHEIHHPILFHANVKQMKQVKQSFDILFW